MPRPTPFLRAALAAASLVLLAGACSSGGSTDPGPGPGPTPTISIALSMSGATVAAGGLVPVTATLTRGGGFTGTVNFTVEGVPAGVTGTVSNIQTSGTTTSATVTIQTSVNTPGGTYPLTVRASGSGVTDATATFNLIVAAGGTFGLTANPSALSISRGSAGNSTIAIGRLGGFAGEVTLTVAGAPTGVTATLAPAATTGNSSTLTVTVGANAALATSTLTIRGNATGQPERTLTIQLTVNAASGGGTASFNISCLAPVWAAFQDGDAGAWTQVVPNGQGLHTFSVSQDRAGFAFATTPGATATVTVLRMTRAEMTAAPQNYCAATQGTKFVNASLTGLAANDRANVWIGNGGASRSVEGAFSIFSIMNGAQDLVAFRKSTLAAGGNPSRGLIRRDLDPANASTLPGIDLNGAESFAAAAAQITVPNFAGNETLAVTMGFRSGASCSFAQLYQVADGAAATSPVPIEGIPAGNLRASDVHIIGLTAIVGGANVTATRVIQQNVATVANRTISMPAPLAVPTVTTLAGPYKRLQAVYPIPADYNNGSSFTYITLSPIRTMLISATTGWIGGSQATMAMPDFSAVAGWNNAWAPPTTATGTWSAQVNGGNITGNLCQADGRVLGADQRGAF